MPSPNYDIASRIKSRAMSLGFDACGFGAAAPVDDEAEARYEHWLEQGHHGCMKWAEGHRDLRHDPSMLLEGAQTVISLALNYYPARFQPSSALRVAYYAYGRDYHEVLREKLTELAHFIEQITHCATRPCVDSAPVRERYWVQLGRPRFHRPQQLLGSFPVRGLSTSWARLSRRRNCRPTRPAS